MSTFFFFTHGFSVIHCQGRMRWYSSGIHAELLGAGVGIALVAALLTWRWGDLGSSPADEILDFSLLFFDFGFYKEIDFLRGMVE